MEIFFIGTKHRPQSPVFLGSDRISLGCYETDATCLRIGGIGKLRICGGTKLDVGREKCQEVVKREGNKCCT